MALGFRGDSFRLFRDSAVVVFILSFSLFFPPLFLAQGVSLSPSIWKWGGATAAGAATTAFLYPAVSLCSAFPVLAALSEQLQLLLLLQALVFSFSLPPFSLSSSLSFLLAGKEEERMNSGAATGSRSPFTASQWQELEHQALIFKHMVAGIPVPPDLLLPIRKSFESLPTRFYPHPSMGYCSFYGKKVDPEPGRCRRTDGKKWRCSKDAYPDSKYCERHMHRGRNRSRKPVETQTISQSSSTVTSLSAPGGGSSGGGGGFQNLPLHSISNPQGPCAGNNSTQLQMEPASFGMGNKDYRPPSTLLPVIFLWFVALTKIRCCRKSFLLPPKVSAKATGLGAGRSFCCEEGH
ncbi:hypothetical protein ACLOJK_039913 [Asimina triloba]